MNLLNKEQFIKLAKEGRIKIKSFMRPIRNYGFVCLTSSSDKSKKVLCSVEPKNIFEDNYFKLYLIAEDKRYGRDEFYLSDILSLINSGKLECIIKNN